MKRLLTLITLLIVTTEINASRDYDTQSTAILRNPPNNYVHWEFKGDQSIRVCYENGNVLGVMCIGSVNAPIRAKEHILLLPGKRSDTFRYSIFGPVPIQWMLSIETNADAALIYGYAEWDPYEY